MMMFHFYQIVSSHDFDLFERRVQVHCQSVHFQLSQKIKSRLHPQDEDIDCNRIYRHGFKARFTKIKWKLATVIDAILRMSFGTQHNSQTGSIIWSRERERLKNASIRFIPLSIYSLPFVWYYFRNGKY